MAIMPRMAHSAGSLQPMAADPGMGSPPHRQPAYPQAKGGEIYVAFARVRAVRADSTAALEHIDAGAATMRIEIIIRALRGCRAAFATTACAKGPVCD